MFSGEVHSGVCVGPVPGLWAAFLGIFSKVTRAHPDREPQERPFWDFLVGGEIKKLRTLLELFSERVFRA